LPPAQADSASAVLAHTVARRRRLRVIVPLCSDGVPDIFPQATDLDPTS